MNITTVEAKSILTRTTGYLKTICSHSLQPYRGCGFGNSLCGEYCYVQHNRYVTRREEWGSFVEAKANAAKLYAKHYERERAWARRSRGAFSIFFSSSTDPFMPHEKKFGISRAVLEMMAELPPDALVVQTRSPSVIGMLPVLKEVGKRCRLRVNMTIESDLERIPGLPAPASEVNNRFIAAEELAHAGISVAITVSPLLPIGDPKRFFERIASVADAVVIDHFIGGDGSPGGSRTRRTSLPAAMEKVLPGSSSLDYRDTIIAIARAVMPGKVGVCIDGFSGKYLPE